MGTYLRRGETYPVPYDPKLGITFKTFLKNLDTMAINAKVVESMRLFAESYAKSTDTYLCVDLDVTESVIQGLSKNKQLFGAPLCPCRYYDNKEDEISLAYWNCPCVPMRERKECHCMLFLTPGNEFASTNQSF
jgi:ferredoxin-thioredoxin reductase catalytic chain